MAATPNMFQLERYHAPAWTKPLSLVPTHRFRLAMLPTPIHRWAVPGVPEGVELYIKRDDLTGMQLSGNKVRKLEFLLAEAVSLGHDSVITCGGIQSNHCRATAVAARCAWPAGSTGAVPAASAAAGVRPPGSGADPCGSHPKGNRNTGLIACRAHACGAVGPQRLRPRSGRAAARLRGGYLGLGVPSQYPPARLAGTSGWTATSSCARPRPWWTRTPAWVETCSWSGWWGRTCTRQAHLACLAQRAARACTGHVAVPLKPAGRWMATQHGMPGACCKGWAGSSRARGTQHCPQPTPPRPGCPFWMWQVTKEEYQRHGSATLIEILAQQLRAEGRNPYLIPVGWGSLPAAGGVGVLPLPAELPPPRPAAPLACCTARAWFQRAALHRCAGGCS
jgi:hypothetical protein